MLLLCCQQRCLNLTECIVTSVLTPTDLELAELRSKDYPDLGFYKVRLCQVKCRKMLYFHNPLLAGPIHRVGVKLKPSALLVERDQPYI